MPLQRYVKCRKRLQRRPLSIEHGVHWFLTTAVAVRHGRVIRLSPCLVLLSTCLRIKDKGHARIEQQQSSDLEEVHDHHYRPLPSVPPEDTSSRTTLAPRERPVNTFDSDTSSVCGKLRHDEVLPTPNFTSTFLFVEQCVG